MPAETPTVTKPQAAAAPAKSDAAMGTDYAKLAREEIAGLDNATDPAVIPTPEPPAEAPQEPAPEPEPETPPAAEPKPGEEPAPASTEIQPDPDAPKLPDDARVKTREAFEAQAARAAEKLARQKANYEAELTKARQQQQAQQQPKPQPPAPPQFPSVVAAEEAATQAEIRYAELYEKAQNGDPAVNRQMVVKAAKDWDDARAGVMIERRDAAGKMQAAEEVAIQNQKRHANWLIGRFNAIEGGDERFTMLDDNLKIVDNPFTREIAETIKREGVPLTFENAVVYASEVKLRVLEGSLKLEQAKTQQAVQQAQSALRKTGMAPPPSHARPPAKSESQRVKDLYDKAAKGDKKAEQAILLHELTT